MISSGVHVVHRNCTAAIKHCITAHRPRDDWVNHWKQQKECGTIEEVYFTKRAVCHVTKQMNDNPEYVVNLEASRDS